MTETAALILDGLAGLELEDEDNDFPSPEVRLAMGSIIGKTQTSFAQKGILQFMISIKFTNFQL